MIPYPNKGGHSRDRIAPLQHMSAFILTEFMAKDAAIIWIAACKRNLSCLKRFDYIYLLNLLIEGRLGMSDLSGDLALLTECISGSKEAWDAFVGRFSKLIYFAINKTLRLHNHSLPQDDVDDLFNSVFVSLLDHNYKKLRQFEGRDGCTLTSWIRLITINHTIDFLRGQKQHISIDDDSDDRQPLAARLPDRGTSFEERLEDAGTARALKEAIGELPESDRLFMELFYEKELKPEEIAGIMNVTVNTVYSKKNRIREKLQKILIDKGAIARNPE